MTEWEGIDRDVASSIVRDAIDLRAEGKSWAEIGSALGVHRTTVSRWARGVSAPPPESRYISRDEARRFSQVARLSVDRRDARRNLNDFQPYAKYARRRMVTRYFVRKGRRYRYRQPLARGATAEQERMMERQGRVYQDRFRERYPRFGR